MRLPLFILAFIFAFSAWGQPAAFRIKKVVIDAGHGGTDPGCHGTHSKEKDVCLSIALHLGKYISENFKDVEVIYTRDKDVFVKLHERAKIANDRKADLFICIHANSGPPAVSGTETYVMGLYKSEANLEIAKRENSVILMEDNYKIQYEGFDPNSDESYIGLSLLQGAYLEQSLNFASKFQKRVSSLERNDRGVKQQGFLVLYRTAMPSVLIETGFLTNKEEEKFLADSVNRSRLAFTIFEAFKEYKNEMERSTTPNENDIVVMPKEKEEKAKKEEKPEDEKPIQSKNEMTVQGSDEKNVNKVKENSIEDDLVIFKVQVASSGKKLPLNADKFRGLDYLMEYKDGSTFKYAAGKEKSMENAVKLQKKLKENGHPDAFVVAFYKEKRITLAEANSILKGKK